MGFWPSFQYASAQSGSCLIGFDVPHSTEPFELPPFLSLAFLCFPAVYRLFADRKICYACHRDLSLGHYSRLASLVLLRLLYVKDG